MFPFFAFNYIDILC